MNREQFEQKKWVAEQQVLSIYDLIGLTYPNGISDEERHAIADRILEALWNNGTV